MFIFSIEITPSFHAKKRNVTSKVQKGTQFQDRSFNHFRLQLIGPGSHYYL